MSITISKTVNHIKKTQVWKHIDIDAAISTIAVVIYFCVLFKTGHMSLRYDTAVNRSIANGDMIGYPNPRIMFSNYVFGLILALLYRIFPMWEWYTLMLLAAMYFSLWAILYKVLSFFKWQSLGIIKKIFWGAAVIFLFSRFFYGYLMVLYGLCCAVIAGTGAFFYLVFTETLRKRDLFIIAVLMLMCAGIRFSVFKEILPFFVLAFIFRAITFNEKKRIAIFAGLLSMVILAMYSVNERAYRGVFAEERELNHYRAAIQDYGRWPEYNKYKDFFLELGLDEDEYAILKAYWGWGWIEELNKDTLIKIIDLYDQEYHDETSTKEKMHALIAQMVFKDNTVTFWRMQLCVAVGVLIVLLKRKDWRTFLLYMSLAGVCAMEILYLAYHGRMPERVTRAPLLALMIFGMGCIYHFRNDFLLLLKNSIFLKVCFMIFAIVCLYGNCMDMENIIHRSNNSFKGIARQLAMVNYALSDQDNVYLMWFFNDSLDLYDPVKRNYTGERGWVTETVDWRTMIQGEYDSVWDALAYRDDIRLVVSERCINLYLSYLNHHGYHCAAESETVELDGYDKTYTVWKITSE